MENNGSQQDISKLRVGVIFGGRSGEHDVSLMSAKSVMSALNREKYDVVQIGISPNGQWIVGNAFAVLDSGLPGGSPATLLPDPESSALMLVDLSETRPIGLSLVSELDVVIPILHGPYGEDGTVQGFLELAGMPYVGAGVVGSAVGMDKAIFKYTMSANDIPILPWILVTSSDWKQQPSEVIEEIEQFLSYPIFTKPANLGSSVGISKCHNREQLVAGIAEAAKYDRRLVVEQGIDARELEVAVLGNDDPQASVVGEIRPRREFYDYFAKYEAKPGSEDESELLIPADIDGQTAIKVCNLAIRAYKAIDCAGMGRVDMLLDKSSGQIYLNEINTIPGFTEISMYPKLWAASGVDYPELLDRLISLALERHDTKEKLEKTFQAS